MKYFVLFLGVLVLRSICATKSSIMVGGYSDYTDFTSPQFQSIINSLNAQVPQSQNYQIVSVKRQLVNGFNYIINFVNKNDKTVTATANIYSTFSGQVTINWKTSSSPNTITASNVGPSIPKAPQKISNGPVIPNQQIGGYKNQTNDSDIEIALAEVYRQHPELKNSKLISTKVQIVAGKNVKFYFEGQNGDKSDVVVYLDLSGNTSITDYQTTNPNLINSSENKTSSQGNETNSNKKITNQIGVENNQNISIQRPNLIGGYFDVNLNETDSYYEAESAFRAANPEYKNLNLIKVEKQIVSGTNYRLTFADPNSELRVVVIIYINFNDQIKIVNVQTIDVKNYTQSEIDSFHKKATQQRPQLSYYQINSITNIWPNKAGIKIQYSLENKSVIAFFYTSPSTGKQVTYLYDLQ